MRFEQFRYLEAAVRAGTLRKAASDMELAQPSLSQQIQRLEEELNTVLLLRSSAGVRPTDACETLLPHMRAALRAEEGILQEASALGDAAKGRVRVGAVGLPTRTFLPGAVRRFQEHYPGVHLEAHEGHSEQIRTQVRAGDLDVGVISRFKHSRDETREFHAEDIPPDVPLCVCVPPGHRLHGRTSVKARELEDEAFVTSPKGHLLRAALEFISETTRVRVVYHTDTSETARIMVQAGVGIAVLPPDPGDVQRGGSESLGYIRLDEWWADSCLSLIRRQHEQPTPAERAFRQILLEEAARLVDAASPPAKR